MHPEFVQLSSLSSIDAEYSFGRPRVYLAPHELARLTILRSRLGDTQTERRAAAAGALPHAAADRDTPRPATDVNQDRNWPLRTLACNR